MKINLRRAATLLEQIRQAVSDVSIDSSSGDLIEKLTHLEELESVLYSLRDKVGKANVETGGWSRRVPTKTE